MHCQSKEKKPCPNSDTGGHYYILETAELEMSPKWSINSDFFSLIQAKGMELPAKASGKCKHCNAEKEFSGGLPETYLNAWRWR